MVLLHGVDKGDTEAELLAECDLLPDKVGVATADEDDECVIEALEDCDGLCDGEYIGVILYEEDAVERGVVVIAELIVTLAVVDNDGEPDDDAEIENDSVLVCTDDDVGKGLSDIFGDELGDGLDEAVGNKLLDGLCDGLLLLDAIPVCDEDRDGDFEGELDVVTV